MFQIMTPAAHLINAVEQYLSGSSDGSVVDLALHTEECAVPGLAAYLVDADNIEPELVRDGAGQVVALNLY